MKKGEQRSAASAKRPDRTEVLAGPERKPLILRKARFVVTGGRDAGRELVIQRALVSIGTPPESDLALTDPTVSRHHAEVEERADGWVLRDHDSTNGTLRMAR